MTSETGATFKKRSFTRNSELGAFSACGFHTIQNSSGAKTARHPLTVVLILLCSRPHVTRNGMFSRQTTLLILAKSNIRLDFFELSTYHGGLYFDNFLQLRSQGNLSRPFFSLAKNSKKYTTAANMFLSVLTTMHLLKSITPGRAYTIFRNILDGDSKSPS